jgi:hypothetical protein
MARLSPYRSGGSDENQAFSIACRVRSAGAGSMAQEKTATVSSPSSPSSTTYITNVTVIDTENGKKIQDRTVIISGDRISEVRDSNGVKPPAGTKVVDGNGKYLIPGLWDMHVRAVFAERMDSMFPLSSPTVSWGFETWERPCLWRTSINCADRPQAAPGFLPGPGHVSADTKGYSCIPLPYSAAQ